MSILKRRSIHCLSLNPDLPGQHEIPASYTEPQPGVKPRPQTAGPSYRDIWMLSSGAGVGWCWWWCMSYLPAHSSGGWCVQWWRVVSGARESGRHLRMFSDWFYMQIQQAEQSQHFTAIFFQVYFLYSTTRKGMRSECSLKSNVMLPRKNTAPQTFYKN